MSSASHASVRSSTFSGVNARYGSGHQRLFTRSTVSATAFSKAGSGIRAQLAKTLHCCAFIASRHGVIGKHIIRKELICLQIRPASSRALTCRLTRQLSCIWLRHLGNS